ncbi:S8 family serine peptidase, partial [Patescibacteria group bacterium]|nr:S8 family serine peptidase [Patescibacteria group bacterium]
SCTYTAPTCTSWTYSDWSICSADDQQTRTIISSSPEGCEGGSPVLIQSCNYTPPACASWIYSNWSSCQSNSTKIRTVISSSPDDCYGGDPTLTQSCTYTAPTCTSWTYSDWSICSADDQQTRTIISSSPEGCESGSPAISQSCAYNDPIINSISPFVIYPSADIIINGHNFGSYCNYYDYNCGVNINNKHYNVLSSDWSDNKINFTLPSNITSGYITIVDKNGKESKQFNFTLSQDPSTIPPVITSISPKSITPGDTISIIGSNFGNSKGSSNLVVGGSLYPSSSILSWSDIKIEYKTSVYSDNSSKKVGIKKCKSYYDCIDIVYGPYFYIQPEITSTDYKTGAVGNIIKIYGNYLKNSNIFTNGGYYYIDVSFNGVKALFPKDGVWTSSMIEVLIPQGATDGYISLEITADGTNEKLTTTGPYFDILEAISNDSYSAYQKYFKQINLQQVWGLASNRKKIIIAVIDDGVYHNHPELKNQMWTNTKEIIGNGKDDDKNGYMDDYYGWNFINNSSEMTPRGTHGTQVAGIIGAETNNNQGMAGVNWNIEIMPLIIFDDTLGYAGHDKANKAIRYAVDNGAEVINLSFGSLAVSGFSTQLNDAIQYAYNKGALIVAAAGNGDIVGGLGYNLNKIPQSPVCNDGNNNMVIGVGAVDDKNYRTVWSNYGTNCVDIWAPGTNILSTAVPAYSTFHNFYDISNGTSFSAPIVTGVVSLLKASYPAITSQEAINLLINNSNSGIIDAYKVLSANFTPLNKQIVKILDNASDNNQQNTKNNIIDSKKVVKEEKRLIIKIDKNLSKRVSGNILLQVEQNGEGWYVYPDNKKKYYLGRPADAFSIMRNLGLGIKHSELDNYLNSKFPSRLAGKIMLDVEQNGEAYYINPNNLKGHYLNRPADAFRIMRELGLGITNSDIRKIDVGEVN